jgi:hypothetical protein
MARWDADAGVKTWAGLPGDADTFLAFRGCGLAWRWGFDLWVTHCCFEHADQTFGSRPKPPGIPTNLSSE